MTRYQTLPWLCLLSIAAAFSRKLDENPDDVLEIKRDWYKRYPQYPHYCSTPDQMQARSIPPLQEENNAIGQTQLVHVTAILRHGARTLLQGPATSPCWDGFWQNPETAVWDCPLKTLSMPPNAQRIQEEEGGIAAIDMGMTFETAMFLFPKSYTALQKPLANVLNGTCELGQLILQGYEQQVQNGQVLRDAYLHRAGEYSTSEKLHLFEVGGENSEPWADETQLYLRSDNAHAPLTSGQLLMRGLFEAELVASRQNSDVSTTFPTIPVHTADHSRDILSGFRDHCEALDLLQQASDNSWEYRQFVKSAETEEVLKFLQTHHMQEDDAFDCLMTTVCTDRPLPDRFGIYNPSPKSWFNRIASYHVANHSFHLNYNDAEYSKLSMGPLWAEIMDHIAPVLGDIMEAQDRPRPPAKLAIYSGYDSTIMEILASLGAWAGVEWPPYASMVLLEIHELLDDASDKSIFGSKFAFRLLYNGQILTDKVQGCTEGMELCDAQHLVNRVLPFARRNVDCIDVNLEKASIHPMQIAKALITTTGGIVLVILIVAVSALIGSIAVFYRLTGSVPTDKLKNLQRQVFRRSSKSKTRGASGPSPFLDEQIEMTMSDAAATPVDDFDDEPQGDDA